MISFIALSAVLGGGGGGGGGGGRVWRRRLFRGRSRGFIESGTLIRAGHARRGTRLLWDRIFEILQNSVRPSRSASRTVMSG